MVRQRPLGEGKREQGAAADVAAVARVRSAEYGISRFSVVLHNVTSGVRIGGFNCSAFSEIRTLEMILPRSAAQSVGP